MLTVHAIKNVRQAGVRHAPRARMKVITVTSARRACAMPGVGRLLVSGYTLHEKLLLVISTLTFPWFHPKPKLNEA